MRSNSVDGADWVLMTQLGLYVFATKRS